MRRIKIGSLFTLAALMLAMTVFVKPAIADEKAYADEDVVGYNGGFFIKTRDDKFKLKINGRFQPQFFMSTSEDDPNTTTDEDGFQQSFRLRRARIWFQGTLWEKLTLGLMLHSGTGSTNFLPITWISYSFSDAATLSAGQVSLPMDRSGEASSGWFNMVEAPLTATQTDDSDLTLSRNAFGLPYDLGVRLDGQIGGFFYGVAVGNGADAWTLNTNNELAFGVRLGYHILGEVPNTDYMLGGDDKPLLTVAIGGGWEDEDAQEDTTTEGTFQHDRRISGSADVAFRWKGFSLTSAFYYRRSDYKGGTALGDSNNDGTLVDIGYYTDLGYFVIPQKLQVVARASQIFREGPDNNANEFGAGLNWYIYKNNLKWQFDYTNVLDYDNIPGLNNQTIHRFRTQLTAQF